MNRKQLSVSLILLFTLFCVSSVFYILKNYSEESVIKQSNQATPKYVIKVLPYGLEL